MTTLEEQFKNDDRFNNWAQHQRRGRIITGLFIIAVAGLFFLKEIGVLFPTWLFTWPVLLISIGIISGIKNQFQNSKWITLVVIGGVFLMGDIFPALDLMRYQIPLILLAIGLLLVFKPKNKHHHFSKYKFNRHKYGQAWNATPNNPSTTNSDDYILINNVFGGIKRNIITKDFKGGEINNTFGGCDLNLMQAEIITEATLTINQQFGGTKIIVPSNWIVKSNVVCVFGGAEDERPPMNVGAMADAKILILTGNVLFGGVEIISY
jgi:predicted membrane protein